MSRKRRILDSEMPESLRTRGAAEQAIREENDHLAHDLVQGMRRLLAYRALHAEAGQGAYGTISAGILPQSDPLAQCYRRMVDENLIRKDISFAEMGQPARAYAEDPANDCDDLDKAVALIFKSASYTKRSHIRAFAALVSRLESRRFAEPIPRNLGVELKRRLDADPGLQAGSRGRWAQRRSETGRPGWRSRAALPETGQGAILSTGKVEAGQRFARKPRTTFDVVSDGRHAKCTASPSRVEVRATSTFWPSTVGCWSVLRKRSWRSWTPSLTEHDLPRSLPEPLEHLTTLSNTPRWNSPWQISAVGGCSRRMCCSIE